MTERSTETTSADTVESNSPNPRALATAAGFLFQVGGLALAAIGVLFLVVDGVMSTGSDRPVARWYDHFAGPQAGDAGRTLLAVIALLGGAAMAAVGVGLQGERAGSGRSGMIVTLVSTILGGAVSVWSFVAGGGWATGIVGSMLALFWLIMFLLAGASESVLRRHPPPEDANRVTLEQLEEMRRERDLRRREMGV